jgi:molybdopterin-guanine dinucleotide biosynthesis protein A
VLDWDAILLAGGRARRLGGIDKCLLRAGGRTLLDTAIAATDGAGARVLVGPDRVDPARTVPRVLEEPRFAGPVAAIAAGLDALADSPSEFVAVVAADQPRADDALPVVLSEVPTSGIDEAWVATDFGGRRHPLLAVYRKAALVRALAKERAEFGAFPRSMDQLLGRLVVRPVRLLAYLCVDIDTRVDVEEHGLALPELVGAR